MSDSAKVRHHSLQQWYRFPMGAQPTRAAVRLRLEVDPSLQVSRVWLRMWTRKDEQIAMRPVVENTPNEAPWTLEPPYTPVGGWEVTVTMPDQPGWAWYYFVLQTPDGTLYYGQRDSMGGEGQLYTQPPELNSYQITVYDEEFTVPLWMRQGVMYQIFVDRFRIGAATSPHVREDQIYHKVWDEQMIFRKDPIANEMLVNDHFGGNLKGIVDALPRLHELGITVLYLNPIFEAFSNHKYDTGNYMKIDPSFGDDATLRLLCREAARFGIRVMLDGVFSHTGSDSMYFNKEGRYDTLGAWQSPESPYYSWYSFEDKNHDKYQCWWGVKTLPNVNEMEESFLDYILRNDDSVVRHWLREGISGWRIDVADELPDEFLTILRQSVKEVDPEAAIIGEVWEDASKKESYGRLRTYLLGRALDSVMNYPLRNAILDFLLLRADAENVNRQLLSLRENYPRDAFYSAMNMLGTHDVARITNILSGAPDMTDRDQIAAYHMSEKQYQRGQRLHRLAVMMQMSLPGMPCVYYGDEAGMTGFMDPFNRGTYPWGREDLTVYGWYRRMIALRKFLVMQQGEMALYAPRSTVWVCLRELEGHRILTAIHCGEETVTVHIPVSGQWEVYAWSGSPSGMWDSFPPNCGERLSLVLGAWEGLVLEQQNDC